MEKSGKKYYISAKSYPYRKSIDINDKSTGKIPQTKDNSAYITQLPSRNTTPANSNHNSPRNQKTEKITNSLQIVADPINSASIKKKYAPRKSFSKFRKDSVENKDIDDHCHHVESSFQNKSTIKISPKDESNIKSSGISKKSVKPVTNLFAKISPKTKNSEIDLQTYETEELVCSQKPSLEVSQILPSKNKFLNFLDNDKNY